MCGNTSFEFLYLNLAAHRRQNSSKEPLLEAIVKKETESREYEGGLANNGTERIKYSEVMR